MLNPLQVWLAAWPLWATFSVLFFFGWAVFFIGREKFEGLPYNVSYSSLIGDVGLMLIVFIGATVLERDPSLSAFFTGSVWNGAGLVVALVASATLLLQKLPPGHHRQWMDIYHNTVVVIFAIGLLWSTVPAICLHGTWVEFFAAFGGGVLWVATFFFDKKTGRLKQRVWLDRHGINLG